MKVAPSGPVTPLGGCTEVGDALGEQLLAVRAEETDQRGKVQEAPVVVLAYFDYEIPVAHERAAVGYLDLDVAESWLLKGVPGRLPYGSVKARPDTRTILTPGTDFQQLLPVMNGETRTAANKSCHVGLPFKVGLGPQPLSAPARRPPIT
jgi:hypothetical protein